MAEDIKSCPYCGSNNLELRRWHGLIGIYCKNKDCPRTKTNYYKTLDAAIKGWNREVKR